MKEYETYWKWTEASSRYKNSNGEYFKGRSVEAESLDSAAETAVADHPTAHQYTGLIILDNTLHTMKAYNINLPKSVELVPINV